MKDVIEKAIKELTKLATSSTDENKSLKFSQAALNLAHVRATLAGANKLESSE